VTPLARICREAHEVMPTADAFCAIRANRAEELEVKTNVEFKQ